MNFKHLLLAVAAGSILAPNAMAKTSGGLRIKHMQAKSVAGKVKKPLTEKIAKAPKAKKPRKNSKRGKSEGTEI